MIERAYHSELVDIYRQAAHIWRCAVTCRNQDASEQQREIMSVALDDVRRVQTIVTENIVNPNSVLRGLAVFVALEWLEMARLGVTENVLQTVALTDTTPASA